MNSGPTELKGHTALIYHVAFSPDGKLLATAGFDNLIKLWEWPSGKEVRTLTGHTGPVYCVAFHPNGSTLASGSRSEEHTSELQSHLNLVCRLLLEKKKT